MSRVVHPVTAKARADTSRLFESAAVYAVASALSSAIPFLLLPVLTRVLSPADFGMAAMFALLQIAFLPLVGLGTKQAVAVQVLARKGDIARFLMACLILVAASSACVAVWLWPFRHEIAAITYVPTSWLILPVAAAAAHSVILLASALWQARGASMRLGAFEVLHSATNVGLTLVLVIGLGYAWEGRVLGQILALVIFAGLAIVILRSMSDLAWPPRADYAREALVFGLPLVPHGLAMAVGTMADRFLLTAMLGLEQTGLYVAAAQLAMLLSLGVHAFNRAYQPWLFSRLREDSIARRERIVRGSYLYFCCLALMATIGGFAARPIVHAVLGPDFHAAAEFIPFLAFGVAFTGMYHLVANYVLLSRRTALLSVASVFSGLVNVGAGIFLISRNGALGAAQAFLLSQLTLFVLAWWFGSRAYPMPWRDAVSLRRTNLRS